MHDSSRSQAASSSPKPGDVPAKSSLIDAPVDYGHAVSSLARRDEDGMLGLAGNLQTPPEMLFLLSQMNSPQIRTLVAENSSTPAAADDVLIGDPNPEIRQALVRKISRLLPEISPSETSKLGQNAIKILAALARDSDVIVRRALSAQICRLEGLPKDAIVALAKDVDALVAVPIFEFSPVLDDTDIIALANGDINPLCLAAIARREHVSEPLSDCLLHSGDTTAVAALLRNQTAHIRETTLDSIVEEARHIDSWRQPLVERAELSEALALKLASFVSDALVGQLAKRNDLSAALTRQLQEQVAKSAAKTITEPLAPAKAMVKRTAFVVELESAIDQRHEAAIMSLLATRADIGVMAVRRIFATRIPKAIIALAWRAELPASLADRLQEFPGRILEARRLLPTENGEFPMTDEEIGWHLNALGVGERKAATA
ncbi:MAG: DUF2336 domain-containing protein [Alphaproteobacteria bacterium]